MFRFAAVILSLVVSGSSALTPDAIPANSVFAKRLMSEARALGNNNNNNNNNGYDLSWAVDYSIKYQGCNTILQFGANNGNNNNNNKNNNNKYGLVSTQTVIRFSLCPTSETSCSTCANGGEYVVGIQNFIEQWTESRANYKEYACEQIRATCDCEEAEDAESCEIACFKSTGHSECVAEEEEYPEDFELQRYLECKELENKNGNKNNNNNNNGEYVYNDDAYNAYYTGPYCGSDGYSIHLGIFADQYCSELLTNKKDVYYNRYGAQLPYSSKSLISKECLSCANQNGNNNNNNNNNNGNAQASELCTQAYTYAAKCESGLAEGVVEYPDNSGCTYIKSVLPKASVNTKSSSESAVYRTSGSTARVFAWLFAVLSVALGAYALLLYRKITRSNVALSHSFDATMA